MEVEPALHKLFECMSAAKYPPIVLVDNIGRLYDEERATIVGLFCRLPVSALVMTIRSELFDKEIAELFEPDERQSMPAMTVVGLKEHIQKTVLPPESRAAYSLTIDHFSSKLSQLGIDTHQAILPPIQMLEFLAWTNEDPAFCGEFKSRTSPDTFDKWIDKELAGIIEHYLLCRGMDPRVVDIARAISAKLDPDQIRICLRMGSLALPPPSAEAKPSELIAQLDLLCQGPLPLAFHHRHSYWLSPFIGFWAQALAAQKQRAAAAHAAAETAARRQATPATPTEPGRPERKTKNARKSDKGRRTADSPESKKKKKRK
jgi:hypothetical protein